jgi:hypothetical protein
LSATRTSLAFFFAKIQQFTTVFVLSNICPDYLGKIKNLVKTPRHFVFSQRNLLFENIFFQQMKKIVAKSSRKGEQVFFKKYRIYRDHTNTKKELWKHFREI